MRRAFRGGGEESSGGGGGGLEGSSRSIQSTLSHASHPIGGLRSNAESPRIAGLCGADGRGRHPPPTCYGRRCLLPHRQRAQLRRMRPAAESTVSRWPIDDARMRWWHFIYSVVAASAISKQAGCCASGAEGGEWEIK